MIIWGIFTRVQIDGEKSRFTLNAQKISLHSTAGKMVFSLSGSYWLKWKKREKYFKDDTAVGVCLFVFCCFFSQLHTVTSSRLRIGDWVYIYIFQTYSGAMGSVKSILIYWAICHKGFSFWHLSKCVLYLSKFHIKETDDVSSSHQYLDLCQCFKPQLTVLCAEKWGHK